jgi:hypothetical protein
MDGWKESLSADLQGKPMVQNAASLEAIINNAIGLESKMGRSISIPGVDAAPEEHTLFLDKVLKTTDKLSTIDNKDDILKKWGRPDELAGYQGDPDKDYGFDMEAAKKEAFDLSLTQDQFFAMVNQRQTAVDGIIDTNKSATEADRATVFDEWGASKAEKLDNIDAFMDLMGFPDGTKTAVRENMTADQLRAFSKAAASVKGETIQAAKDKSTGADRLTPMEANQAIDKIMESPSFNSTMDPNHKNVMNRYYQLLDMAAGRQPQEYYAT